MVSEENATDRLEPPTSDNPIPLEEFPELVAEIREITANMEEPVITIPVDLYEEDETPLLDVTDLLYQHGMDVGESWTIRACLHIVAAMDDDRIIEEVKKHAPWEVPDDVGEGDTVDE